MKTRDITTDLNWKLAAILEGCKRIKASINSYLSESDERPEISPELLSILSAALGAYGLLRPDKSSGEFHGFDQTATPKFTIRHQNAPDWDFEPWLLEKLNDMQCAAKSLVEEWLTDLSQVKLKADSPMTPREWLRYGITLHFRELQSKAQIIFKEVCSDELTIFQPDR